VAEPVGRMAETPNFESLTMLSQILPRNSHHDKRFAFQSRDALFKRACLLVTGRIPFFSCLQKGWRPKILTCKNFEHVLHCPFEHTLCRWETLLPHGYRDVVRIRISSELLYKYMAKQELRHGSTRVNLYFIDFLTRLINIVVRGS